MGIPAEGRVGIARGPSCSGASGNPIAWDQAKIDLDSDDYDYSDDDRGQIEARLKEMVYM